MVVVNGIGHLVVGKDCEFIPLLQWICQDSATPSLHWRWM